MEYSSESKIEIKIKGEDYSYTYSRGLLAHQLVMRGIDLDEAYQLAFQLQQKWIEKGRFELTEKEYRKAVREIALEMIGPDEAAQFNIIEKWHNNSSFPLIVLIAGSQGTNTLNVANRIGEKLAIPRIFSTASVTQILRRVVAKDLSPELHRRSYEAHEHLRPIYSVLYDRTLIGFEEHSKYVAEALEALIERSITEGLSIVIHGEHIVPRFISNDLLENRSVIFSTIGVSREKFEHNLRKQDKSEQNINEIWKIHNYLIEESQKRNQLVLNKSENENLKALYSKILDNLSLYFQDCKFEEYKNSIS